MSCANHHQCIDDALARAEAICARSGARLTPIRRDVLREVWSSHEATKAYDLMERLSRRGDQVKPPTVYRALDFLLEQGLAHKIESLHAFIGCTHPEHPHASQFLICAECGRVTELEDAAIAQSLTLAAGETGFRPSRPVVEVIGTCADCVLKHL